MMRGSFLLLLHATGLFGASLLDQMEVSASDCRTPGCDRLIPALGKNLTRLSSLGGILDFTSPPTSQPLGCPTTHCKRLKKRSLITAGGSTRRRHSGLVGIAALPSSALPDAAQSTKCPALHCKRKSLKNSENTICCPIIRSRYGRLRCPKSCD